MNTIPELQLLVCQHSPDCMMITEACPKNSAYPLLPVSVHIQGYDTFCNFDKPGVRGVIIYIKETLSATDVTFSIDFCESIWCSVNLPGNMSLLLGCVYRSPSSSPSNNEQLCKLVAEIASRKEQHLFLGGDFNYPDIDWSNWYADCSDEHPAQQFLTATQDFFLAQHVLYPTRHRDGQKPNDLDLLFTDELNIVNNIEYLPPLGKSDHLCLVVDLVFDSNDAEEESFTYSFDKGHYDIMRGDFAHQNWEDLFADQSCTESWKLLPDMLYISMEKKIPKRSVKRDRRRNLYITRKAVTLSKKKQRLWKRYLSSDSMWDYTAYMRERDLLRTMTRQLCSNFEQQVASGSKANPKIFWRYVNSKAKTRSKVSNLTRTVGSTACTALEKADVLNEQFSSVFTKEDLSAIPRVSNSFTDVSLDHVTITPDVVAKKLVALKVSKSAGSDNIHPRILKELASELCTPLSLIFNLSLNESVLPLNWKSANITAIHKKGSRKDPGNYRPISLTAVSS